MLIKISEARHLSPGISGPEALLREGFAGVGFEVRFKIFGTFLRVESHIKIDLPRQETGCVGGFSIVVLTETTGEVVGFADVSLFGVRDAAKA